MIHTRVISIPKTLDPKTANPNPETLIWETANTMEFVVIVHL